MNELKKPTVEMFDPKTTKERIGDRLKKSDYLKDLKEVEEYFIEQAYYRGFETSYDVTANENLSFRTLGYTEWGGCFLAFPLQNDIRMNMIMEAKHDLKANQLNWANYFRNVLKTNKANKYKNREKPKHKPRKNLVVLLGTNKLRDVVDLRKLLEIKEKGDVWFKPHPLTTHEHIGLLMDKLGEDNILPRDSDLYYYLQESEKVYATHYTESILYAFVCGKEIEPIDVYGKHLRAGFWHLNSVLLRIKGDRDKAINTILSSTMSGVFNPRLDPNWKKNVDAFLDLMRETRESYRGWYIDRRKDSK